MSKVGRNDPCPCGSGKKFKRCCLERVEAEERAERLRVEAERAEAEFGEVDEFVETLEHARAVVEESQIVEQVDRLSEAVLRGIEAGRFDEADSAARQLMAGFPDEPLGFERLAQVHEARGQLGAAAAEYRRGVALMDELGEGHYCDCCRARMVKAIRRLDPDRPAPALLRDPQ
ncbi:MAG: SEC-C domain-containing protein [Myxococcales bacterium]|nr:SEC-C domain-containing protein [Myxococcales bacterium]